MTISDLGGVRCRAVLDGLEQLPQRQDSTDDQLRDVYRAALRLGCYDAANLIRLYMRREPSVQEDGQ